MERRKVRFDTHASLKKLVAAGIPRQQLDDHGTQERPVAKDTVGESSSPVLPSRSFSDSRHQLGARSACPPRAAPSSCY